MGESARVPIFSNAPPTQQPNPPFLSIHPPRATNPPPPTLQELPSDVTSVVRSTAFDGESRGPSLDSVLKVLSEHGIEAKGASLEGFGDASAAVAKWLQDQRGQPVVILHHESPSSYHYIQRALQTSDVPTLTEFQISQYQICLWTGFFMVALVMSAVCGMCKMEVIPDSLLFAKFISARTNKHD